MARTDSLGNFLADIAAVIKEKKGTTSPISAKDFDTEIDNVVAKARLPVRLYVLSPSLLPL